MKDLKMFAVTGTAGKLSLRRVFMAKNEGSASRMMNRALSSHPGYKPGTKIEITSISETAVDAHAPKEGAA